jgi:hypothetical protein
MRARFELREWGRLLFQGAESYGHEQAALSEVDFGAFKSNIVPGRSREGITPSEPEP